MFRYFIPALAAFAMTLGLPSLARAEASAETSTLIVYRAEESFNTERLRFDLHANDHFMGRMKAEGATVLTAPAGSYTLDTSLPGAEAVTVELKPGATHYVHSRLDLRGNTVKVEMVEVAEQVARSHGATDRAGTI